MQIRQMFQQHFSTFKPTIDLKRFLSNEISNSQYEVMKALVLSCSCGLLT